MKKEQLKNSSLSLMIVSGLFVLITSVILIINHIQISGNDPLESEVMNHLVERFTQEPDNAELIQDIRQLDLLARKAYFNSIWQVRTGVWILLISAFLFIVSVRVYFYSISKISKPELSRRDLNHKLAIKWLLVSAGLLLIFSLIVSRRTISHLSIYESTKDTSMVYQPKVDDQLEVVELIPIETTETEAEIKESIEEESAQETIVEPTAKTESETLAEKVIEKKEPIKEKLSEKQEAPNAPKAKESSPDFDSNFYTFRGKNGNGLANAKNTPIHWDAKSSENIKWKVEIPLAGYNSPVIWENKLFLAGADENTRKVFCYDCTSGELKWSYQVENIPGSPATSPKTTDDTGLSAPTTSCNGNAIFAIFGNGDIVSLDLNGKLIWAKNLGVPDNHYGHSSSLINYKNQLFVQYDSNKDSKLISLNTANGDINWTTKRSSRISWASPTLAEINGAMQIILSGTPIVAGYDVETGKELWSVDCMMGEVGPSPAYYKGLIFAANEYAKLAAIDSKNNYNIKWESDEYLPEVASPVVENNLLFIATSYGVIACYDAINGDKKWEYEADEGFYSSPIIADNKVYFINRAGTGYIFDLSAEMNLLSTPKIYEQVVTIPAFADNGIYIRTKTNLYYISSEK